MTRRTYSHLSREQRMPSLYEIVSTDLLYHPKLGVAVDNPVTDFLGRHASRLPIPPEPAFADQRQTTYSTYVDEQRRRETFVSELFSQTTVEYERRLSPAWLDLLERVFAPLRYPCHALMMLAGELGATATESRRAIVLAFVAADEVRRIDRFAERLWMLRRAHGTLGDVARTTWEDAPWFQPLRELAERALACHDVDGTWLLAELALKPCLDAFVTGALAEAAERHGDVVLARLLVSLAEDTAWHAGTSEGWLGHLLRAPGLREALIPEIEREVGRAVAALAPLVDLVGGERAFDAALLERRRRLAALGVGEGG